MNVFSLIHAFVAMAMLHVVNADRWYVNWLDLECVSHEENPMQFWSVVYKSKKVRHLMWCTIFTL